MPTPGETRRILSVQPTYDWTCFSHSLLNVSPMPVESSPPLPCPTPCHLLPNCTSCLDSKGADGGWQHCVWSSSLQQVLPRPGVPWLSSSVLPRPSFPCFLSPTFSYLFLTTPFFPPCLVSLPVPSRCRLPDSAPVSVQLSFHPPGPGLPGTQYRLSSPSQTFLFPPPPPSFSAFESLGCKKQKTTELV